MSLTSLMSLMSSMSPTGPMSQNGLDVLREVRDR